MAAGLPDAWVVADGPLGWSGIGGRLTATTWRACRTVAFSGLAHPNLPLLAGTDAVEGMRGSTAAGAGWAFVDGVLRVAGRG